jgi:hypothetical protein
MSRSFNGTSDYLVYSGAVDAGHPMSFALWFNRPSTTFATAFSISNTNVSNPNRNSIILSSTPNVRAFSANSGGTTTATAISTANYSTNTWHHACAIFSSNSSRTIYLDGGNSATNTTTVNVNTGSFVATTIGGFSNSGSIGQPCDGLIAEVAVWDASLTAEDARALASGMSPILIRPDVLVAYWPLYGEASPEPERRNRYEMTVNGATAAEHPRVYMPRFPHTNLNIRRNLTLVATDAPDIADLQATVTAAAANATISATEGYTDAASLQATVTAVTANATLVATDANDSASLIIKVPVNAVLSGTDTNDSANLNANVLVSTILVATETIDAASLNVNVATNCTLNTTDTPDSAALNCSVPVNFVLTATETQDSAILRMDTGAGVVGLEPLVGMMANTGTLLLRH